MQISAITLGCSDLSRSVAFYEQWFDVPASVDGSGVAYFFKQGTPLALFARDALANYCGVGSHGSGFRAMTLSINLTSEAAVMHLAQRACALGAQLVREPGAVDWGGYIAWIGDLDGHLWELVFNPSRPTANA
ncbi:MAG: catechol 2,3-dioxygenase-like lactoylglutathione lyase family enzyme [Gammaproteobacteria bacterium]|jgi:catechol 2,3-dioxygenase-like lactoylglutathione lyase family enzyme